MTADEYGFRPLPPEGMRTRVKVLVGGAVLAAVVIVMTLALRQQYANEANRLSKVLTQPYETLASYHYVAIDDKGRVYEVWFQSPDKWRFTTPDGYFLSDGSLVLGYETATNLYVEGPAAELDDYLGIPVGPTTPEAIRNRIADIESSGTAWKVADERFLGRDVEVFTYGRNSGMGGFVHSTRIDSQYMFVLSSSNTSLSGVSYFTAINNVEYNPVIALDTFVATPPPGACPKSDPTGC